ncbi:MAG: chromosome condensation protein CrcB [Halobacteriales archaeon SW_9_67_24]|nr:MAG: chromosome condensation protein CrcB [Halobacteriales archaeon SW_9_67_24]
MPWLRSGALGRWSPPAPTAVAVNAHIESETYPLGTLTVNVLGSFVLGFVLYEAIHTGVLAERTRVVVATGFLSSLTTYSTFALQTAVLRRPAWIVANVLATYCLGLAGVLAGRSLATRVDGRPGE